MSAKYPSRLTIISEGSTSEYYLCRCECGKVKEFRKCNINRGTTSSCGCRKKELMRTHGMTKTRTYETWLRMIQRATNPNIKHADRYVERGITVCDRWRFFENFLEDMGEIPDEMTLDRIDNDGDYSKENCRYISHKEQQRNRNDNINVIWNGKTQCLTDWSKETGIGFKTLSYRLEAGWTPDEMFQTPTDNRKLSRAISRSHKT